VRLAPATEGEVLDPMTIQVEAARIPDRDMLLGLLREHGLEAQTENEVGIVVPTQEGDGEVFSTVEELIMRIGAPFVPIKHEDVIYIRPPVG
jgi:hypothetical protein